MVGKRAINRYTAFLQKVDVRGFDPDQCWPYLGAGKGNGYGNVRVGDENKSAHSYAYELFVGEIPEGEEVCHTCDFRPCCNPNHLFTGSRQANMDDMVAKGRGDGGNRKWLTEATVQEIRRRLARGERDDAVAKILNVHRSTIGAIRRGESYGRVAQ